MLQSILESLPNEILNDVIEKYINGVDVLVALSYQLNQRFNTIIARCQRFYFNFIQCEKDNFRIYMSLLPANIGKIEILTISERNTRGQVYGLFKIFFSRLHHLKDFAHFIFILIIRQSIRQWLTRVPSHCPIRIPKLYRSKP